MYYLVYLCAGLLDIASIFSEKGLLFRALVCLAAAVAVLLARPTTLSDLDGFEIGNIVIRISEAEAGILFLIGIIKLFM